MICTFNQISLARVTESGRICGTDVTYEACTQHVLGKQKGNKLTGKPI